MKVSDREWSRTLRQQLSLKSIHLKSQFWPEFAFSPAASKELSNIKPRATNLYTKSTGIHPGFHACRQTVGTLWRWCYESLTCPRRVLVSFRELNSMIWISKNYRLEIFHIDGLVQERRNSSALAMELRLSCTNPSIYQFPCKKTLQKIRSFSIERLSNKRKTWR